MAPSGLPRGRPRKVKDSITSSAASSRSASIRRSSRLLPGASEPPSIISGRNASDFHPLGSTVIAALTKSTNEAKEAASRASLSSVPTPHSYNESSGYSTPTTSAFVTPAPPTYPTYDVSVAPPTTNGARRPRRPAAAVMASPRTTVSAVSRAAALRNSQYSLGPSSNKRKRFIVADSDDDGDDDDIDVDEDDSPDAQLARALQKQEDAAAKTMDAPSGIKPRRSPRALKDTRQKSYSLSHLEDSDDEYGHYRPAAKKPKVVLRSSGSNAVSFSCNEPIRRQRPQVIHGSDDSDAFIEIDDSQDDELVAESSTSTGTQKLLSLKSSSSISMNRAPLRPQVPRASTVSSLATVGFARGTTRVSSTSSSLSNAATVDLSDSEFDSDIEIFSISSTPDDDHSDDGNNPFPAAAAHSRSSRFIRDRIRNVDIAAGRHSRRSRAERARLEAHHPEINTMWKDLENLPKIGSSKIDQPISINRELKPFQLEGVAWMKAMEETEWGGGLLGDEMGMGKTIQAVSLIMTDFPAPQPSLVLVPPVALMQWQQEIAAYTDGTLKTFVFHGTNAQTKGVTVKELMEFNVILMSYNSLESMYRKQEKGFKRKNGLYKEKSVMHQIRFHRVILDEAHNIKQRTTGCAKACFALKADHKWCLSGTPLQNRIGEFFSLVRFLDIRPFACYFCKQCPCSTLNWNMNEVGRCKGCDHSGMQHVSVFNQELLNPIQKFGNQGPGKEAFRKLRILTDRFMLRRVKRDHSSSMELPAKEIYVDRQFFGEEENDFAGSIMNNGTRKFETYVAQGVLLNNYANIFGLIMQMRQVADHPDLILKRNGDGGQNILVCCICDETAEEAIRSACRHDFCRECAKNYLKSSDSPDCPTCHIPLSMDLEQPEMEQDEQLVKKSSIINRIKMENWTSSSKIETLVHDLYQLRKKNMSSKSIIFSQFTTMLQLVEWRLRRAGITTVMLDGSMTPAQRQASINHFMTDVNVECFLVSLKAGGVALNLTEASKVFIVDPWWNPAAEWQSADRCHRIGQSRPCSVTRLCIEDSVESRMVLLQEKKSNMINSTINADQSAMESLTSEDMQFLFRGS